MVMVPSCNDSETENVFSENVYKHGVGMGANFACPFAFVVLWFMVFHSDLEGTGSICPHTQAAFRSPILN